jgi:hypothetical protein
LGGQFEHRQKPIDAEHRVGSISIALPPVVRLRSLASS